MKATTENTEVTENRIKILSVFSVANTFSIRPPRSQRGLALITAMLVVAIVATIAAYLSLGQQVWLRQVQNLFDRNQADSMRHAALHWIGTLLARDAKENQTDHLGETWAGKLPPVPFEGGVFTVTITDAQGRFNLNNLVRNGAPSAADIGVFQQLLKLLDLNPLLTDALVDWLDADSQTRPGGAEDTEYMTLNPPYRAGNQLLTSIDELRLVKGFDAKTVEALRPYVVALPQTTSINANTASDVVFAAICPDMPLAVAQQIVRARESQPYTDTGQITQRLPTGQRPPQVALAVATTHFLVQLNIGYGRGSRSTLALIQRTTDGKSARVLWHHPLYPKLPSHDEDGKDKS